MKTTLTIEQSQRLIELGVDPSKASAFDDWRTESMFAPGEKRIFTLADILSLLPRKIAFGHRSNCRLKIQAVVSSKDGLSEVWQACYLHTSRKVDYETPELIDALYGLLVWCITNKHLKV